VITLVLPWPPSVNNYWKVARNKIYIHKDGKEFRQKVAEQVLLQDVKAGLTGPIMMTIEAWRPDNRVRDLDNVLKATLDGLQKAGVYENDSQIKDLRIYWSPSIGGFIKIHISRMPDGR
jgi:crossover junction endodeoxyribonuclease RusA